MPGWEETRPGVLHGHSLHVLSPGLAAPLGLLCQCTSSIPQLPPSRDPRTTCQLTGHKKAAVCSTKQTKTKRSSLTTREGFQQTTTSHTFTLPADSLVDDSVHTKPSTVLPHETVTSQTSLSLGLDSDQEVRGGSRSPTLPAPRGREALPRCSVAHFYPPSECDIPGDW